MTLKPSNKKIKQRRRIRLYTDNEDCTCPECSPDLDSAKNAEFMRELGRKELERIEDSRKREEYILQLCGKWVN